MVRHQRSSIGMKESSLPARCGWHGTNDLVINTLFDDVCTPPAGACDDGVERREQTSRNAQDVVRDRA